MPSHPNRLGDYFENSQEYWFHGPQRRFAREAGVSESALSRILRQDAAPSYRNICRIVALLEKKLGKKLDPRDIFQPEP